MHNESDEKAMKEYFATHTDEEFAKDIVDMTVVHLGFFYYFMVLRNWKKRAFQTDAFFDIKK